MTTYFSNDLAANYLTAIQHTIVCLHPSDGYSWKKVKIALNKLWNNISDRKQNTIIYWFKLKSNKITINHESALGLSNLHYRFTFLRTKTF